MNTRRDSISVPTIEKRFVLNSRLLQERRQVLDQSIPVVFWVPKFRNLDKGNFIDFFPFALNAWTENMEEMKSTVLKKYFRLKIKSVASLSSLFVADCIQRVQIACNEEFDWSIYTGAMADKILDSPSLSEHCLYHVHEQKNGHYTERIEKTWWWWKYTYSPLHLYHCCARTNSLKKWFNKSCERTLIVVPYRIYSKRRVIHTILAHSLS